MKYSNTIEYNISTKLDSSGLTKLQSQIKQLENSMQQMANREFLNSDKVEAAKTQLEGLNTALTNSFNSSLGILDLSKFRAELDAGGVSAKGLQSAFSMMGTEGQAALSSLTTQIANFNGGIERTSSAVDKIFTTFSNTFRWGMVSSFFSQFMNAIHSSIDYVKELDDSLTQIMLVTDYNKDSMNEFARSANEAAKAVSMTTTGMTNASLIFAQQGYNLGQSQELATLSAKVANASQQDTATTSDQITAYMNAYGLENSISELTQAMDNWALIANISAADVSELAQASQRAASMANAVGVSGEALAAQIATIESVTREAPEQIGNGLKTLYARFSDISLGGEDEDGVGLGKVTSTLEGIGVKVLDQFGNIRTMDDIMEDLMVVWDDLDSTAKTAAAQALAGKYQVNRFEALMENSDMYRQYKDATGENAAGTLDTMNEEYANSIVGRSAKMQASLEGLFSTVFNTDDIYPWMDAAQTAIDLLQQFFDALGGGKTILLGITTLLSQAFNQNIARNINDAIANRNLAKIREQNIATVSDTLDKAGIDRTQGVGKYIADTADQAKLGALSDAQYDNYMGNVKELEESATALINAEREMTKDFDSYNMVMNKLGQKGTAAIRSEEEGLNTTQGSEEVVSNSKKKIQDFEIDLSDDIEQAQKLEKALQEVRKALDELHEASKKGIDVDKAAEKAQEKAKAAKEVLKEIEKAAVPRDEKENRTIFEVGDTPKEIETAIDSIEALSTEVEEEAREADRQLGQVEERIRTIHKEAVKFSSDPKATQAMALTGDQKLVGDQVAISGLEARKKAAEDMAAGSAQSIINQQQIKDVLDFVQGIQELTVAWQAFQNLGELWSNKDLLIGEKILQTVMNLAVVIPSVIDAYEKLRKVGSVIQTLGTLQEVLTAKSIAATAATSGFSVANLALATSSKVAAGGVGILKAALEGLSSIPVVAAVGAIIIALQHLQSEFQKSQDAATESFNKYGEALSQTQIDTSGFDEAYQKYKETGIVSDELRDSALELTESLDITGGEAFIASGNFDALAKSIEWAKKESNDLAESMADKTLSRLEANSKKYIPFMQDTFSAETLTADDTQGIYFPGTEHIWDENLKLNYFDAFGRDISGMDFGEKIEDISKKSEIANKNLDNLIERKEKLEKKDPAKLTDDEQLFLQDIEEKIRKAEETANVLESLLGREDVQQYQQITNQEKTRNLKNLDDNISNDIQNQQSIFNAGKYDEAKNYLLQQEGVDTSNVDMLIEKYAQLAENEELAAEAALKVRDQQIADNVGTGNFIEGPFGKFEQKAGMQGRDQIDQLVEDFGLSLKDKAKISDMIDWTDPTVDSKVEELVEKIQKGLEDGVSLDNLLNSINPEDIKNSLSEMKPIDPEIDEESFQNLANYIHDNWENLEELNEALGESAQFLETDAEYVADVTEAILRYQDALDESAEKMEDWLEALNSDDLEERSNAINEIKDSMEDFLNLDAGSLSDDFVEAEDNMQLFQNALAGVDGAYNELLEKALVNKFQLDVDNEPAMAALDDCLTALDNFDGYANTDFGPLTLDDSQAIAALENVINAFGMSSEAAQEFAKSMGYEIEVEPVDVQQEGQSQSIGWTPQETGGIDLQAETFVAGPPLTGAGALTSNLQGGSATPINLTKGPPINAHVDGFTFIPQPDQEKETKNTPLTQIKTKTGNGETSGGLKIKSLKRIAPTGGGKAANTSRPSSSGGRGGGSCFVAGTLISTSFGYYKPIELIRPDDFILSYNESLHQNEYSKVIQTMIHDTIEPIYTLYIKNEQLRVTGIHRFLVSKDINFKPQWIAVQDLQIGDWVLLADSTWHLIWKIEVNLEHQIVYNFEVAGNHNYYVGRNQILAHNKGGGGKKGGGGSGSGQKAKTAKKKEAEKAEKKYYEEVDKQLEQTKETLDSLEKVTDKLTGTQARAKQNEQLKMLQKEKDLQEKKLKILQEQEKVDVSSAIKKADKDFEDLLKKQGVNFNLLDFTFDEEGFIDNLDPVRESIANGINKLNDQYNAIIGDDGEVSDEEQERLKALDEEIQKLQKLGKEVEKNGTRYNEIVIEEQKIQNEMQEIQDQMQDIAIDAYKASQEAIDNLKDLRKEWAKFSAGLYDSSKGESFLSLDNPIRQLKEIENEISSIYAVSGAEARKYYDDVIAQQQKYLENAKTADEQQAYKDAIEYYEKLRDSIDDGAVLNNGLMQIALNDLTRLQEIWNNWNDEGGNGFFGDDKAALEKALEDAQKRVMEFAQDFEELIEDLKDATLDVADHTMEQWDRQLDRYDRVIDQLDRYSDTYSLIYGDASYDMQEAVLSQQAQTLKSELDAAQEAYLAANTYYLEAYEKFVDKSTGLAKEGYEDYIYELEEAMNDAEDKVRDIAADAAEKFSEAFEAAVMASTQYILRNTIGENDFEHSDRNWEWDKEYINKYRDGVEKAYEMDKLRNRYIDMLNNAQGASLQTQNKIRAQMQEQLDLLDGQKTISEYDVKLANAKLEILQKQIALEDAQRNKNKMQLRRDTQGNYRYVYTADKDNVDQAQQELLDSEYDAYEMSKQQQMNNYDDMINAYKRYLSQREEILTNNNLSEAQKMEQIKELWDRFQKYVNAAQEDFGDATAGTVDILQWLVVNGTDYTATAATDMLNQLLDAEGNVAEQSGVIWMDLANNMANEVIPSIADAVTTADDVIEQKLVQTGIALVGEDGTGGVFGEVSNGANDFGDQCEMAANQTAILAEQSNKLKEALLGDSDAFVEIQGKLASYQKQLEDVAEASSNTARALRDTQTALDKANAEKLNYKTQIDRLLSGQDIIVDHKIVDAEEYRRQQEEEKRKQQQRNSGGGGGRNALADARAIWYHGAWGNGGDWYTPYSRQFGTAAANKVLWYFNHGYGYNFDFDTGGYTGEWNQGEGVSSHKNGKLAFLHQKELILNAQDTENILSAVSMVRSLANSAQASMNNINTAASSNINSIYNPVTEQRVDIQASFPNATDAEDIRQALIGLSDRAYQYAHRVI